EKRPLVWPFISHSKITSEPKTLQSGQTGQRTKHGWKSSSASLTGASSRRRSAALLMRHNESISSPVTRRYGKKSENGIPNLTVQRTGASRFTQKQIAHQRRLAPVADLCVRRISMSTPVKPWSIHRQILWLIGVLGLLLLWLGLFAAF